MGEDGQKDVCMFILNMFYQSATDLRDNILLDVHISHSSPGTFHGCARRRRSSDGAGENVFGFFAKCRAESRGLEAGRSRRVPCVVTRQARDPSSNTQLSSERERRLELL